MHDGIIICKHSINYDVESADGKIILCTARKKIDKLVCGDRVSWEPLEDNKGVITDLYARKNLLSRPDKRGAEKSIASNIDQLNIVVSLQPNDKLPDIDRYIVASELLNMTPVIVLNKIDMLSAEKLAGLDSQLDQYRGIGYHVIHTSATRQDGLRELIKSLAGKTSIFVGQSGVGKSSIIKALLPEEDIRIGALSDTTGLGKHTTSVSRLYHTSGSASIIDSPGVREFGLWQIPAEQLVKGFREFLPLAQTCQFSNCIHHTEPGCAIARAASDGVIQQGRYVAYLKLLEEIRQ